MEKQPSKDQLLKRFFTREINKLDRVINERKTTINRTVELQKMEKKGRTKLVQLRRLLNK